MIARSSTFAELYNDPNFLTDDQRKRIDDQVNKIVKQLNEVKCPQCNSSNVLGMYLDEYYDGEVFWTWEPANSKTSLEPDLYEKFSCEDCKYEWDSVRE